jgi:hypothetical protein
MSQMFADKIKSALISLISGKQIEMNTHIDIAFLTGQIFILLM